jgi:hypothetical protein
MSDYILVPMTEDDLAKQRVKHALHNDTPINFGDLGMIAEQKAPDISSNLKNRLEVGTKVVFTNDYGISFADNTILRVERDEYGDAYYTDHVAIVKSDGEKILHWSPWRRRQLTVQGNS